MVEAKGSSQPARKTVLQLERSTKPCQAGSAIDFEHAYRKYNRRVYAKCLSMVGNKADAEDLTQEVFLHVFRKMDSFRGESAFSTWLYRVAINVVLARLRKKSLITSSLEEITESKEVVSSLHQFLGAPDNVLTAAVDRLDLEGAVSHMPAGYRKVFLLYDVEGYAHHEISRMLGLTTGTSKSQLHKARIWLRAPLLAGTSKQLRRRVSRRPRSGPHGASRRRTHSHHLSFSEPSE
jgi:RNA polymerase sigma-70 factor (ECF subfamily)